MPSKETYMLAKEFQELALWKKLSDSEMFGVRYGDITLYCCVMGMAGSFFALGVFPGARGLGSYFSLLSDSSLFDLSKAMEQDEIICSFSPANDLEERDLAELKRFRIACSGTRLCPMMRRYKPGMYPWYVDDEDEAMLAAALRGAIYIAKQLNDESHADEKLEFEHVADEMARIPVLTMETLDTNALKYTIEREPLTVPERGYVSPVIRDDLLCARVRRADQESRLELVCELMRLPMPVDGEPPYYPLALIMINVFTCEVLAPLVSEDEDGLALDFAQSCVEQCPIRILVRSERTKLFFAHICEELDIPLGEMDETRTDYARINAVLNDLSGMCGEDEFDDDFSMFDVPSHIEQGYLPQAEDDDLFSLLGGMDGLKQRDILRFSDTGYDPPVFESEVEGKCEYCKKVFTRQGMLRHLKSCKQRKREAGEQEYFLIRVQSVSPDGYYLYLDVAADTLLSKLDDYLRDIWVECCGHDSVFEIGREEYYSDCIEVEDKPMSVRLNKILRCGSRFRYEYDFGEPTDLELTVCDSYKAKRRRAKITLAARNLPPEIFCERCEQPATYICPECTEMLCGECARKHECAPMYELLPVTNSPRSGMCGYGRVIDDVLSNDDDE